MRSKQLALCLCALILLQLPFAQLARANEFSVWTHRGEIRSRFERAAERELKSVFLLCSHESSQRVLGFEEMARCSIASEVLKERVFGGDFHAMLAWWRQHRHDFAAPP